MLTQIRRTAPPHERFEREMHALCARAVRRAGADTVVSMGSMDMLAHPDIATLLAQGEEVGCLELSRERSTIVLAS